MSNSKLRKCGRSSLIAIAAALLLIAAWSPSAQALKASGAAANASPAATVEVPLLSGWYDGDVVYYITTDVSQAEMARAAGANYVPRLRHALRTPEPGQPSAVDRVYKFSNFEQGSVFPSAPQAAADDGGNAEYTPFWVVYQVTWLPGSKPHLLRSEQEISEAESKKQVGIAATDVVVNCPILFSRKSGPPVGIKTRNLNQ
ncbi:MAG TPA: hypothetical protein VIF60_15970 [Burkholderiaceae bacterium]